MKSSISRMKLFKACRRAYWFRYVEGLIPVKKSDALETGSNYHELIERMLKGENDVLQDCSKECAIAEAFQKYLLPDLKVHSVERWVEKSIGRHVMIGRVDGVSEDGFLIEHKTTSMEITEEYEYNLLWDEQILAYMYMTGMRSIYYTVMRKPTIRKKKNESDEEFYQRMVDWYDEDTESKIRLLKISRTDDEIDAFAEEFQTVCDEMESGVIYRNQGNCMRWGTRCEYASVCLNYDPNQEYIEFTKGG